MRLNSETTVQNLVKPFSNTLSLKLLIFLKFGKYKWIFEWEKVDLARGDGTTPLYKVKIESNFILQQNKMLSRLKFNFLILLSLQPDNFKY